MPEVQLSLMSDISSFRTMDIPLHASFDKSRPDRNNRIFDKKNYKETVADAVKTLRDGVPIVSRVRSFQRDINSLVSFATIDHSDIIGWVKCVNVDEGVANVAINEDHPLANSIFGTDDISLGLCYIGPTSPRKSGEPEITNIVKVISYEVLRDDIRVEV